MNSKALAITILVLLGVSGCIFRALNPLFSDSELLDDSALVGRWANADSKIRWEIEKNRDETLLSQITLVSLPDTNGAKDSKIIYDTVYFKSALGRIGKSEYLDLLPLNLNESKSSSKRGHMYELSFLPTHTFVRINASKNKIVMQEFDYDILRKYISEKKIKTGFAEYQTGEREGKPYYEYVLTAKTKELQEFIQEYSKLPNVFKSPDTLFRTAGNY